MNAESKGNRAEASAVERVPARTPALRSITGPPRPTQRNPEVHTAPVSVC